MRFILIDVKEKKTKKEKNKIQRNLLVWAKKKNTRTNVNRFWTLKQEKKIRFHSTFVGISRRHRISSLKLLNPTFNLETLNVRMRNIEY